MSLKKLRCQMWEIPARVGGAVHLGTMVVDSDAELKVVEFFEDFNETTLKVVFPEVDEEAVELILEGDGDALAEVVEESKRLGWVVRMEVPIFDNMGIGHWGQYTWAHFYADEYKDAVAQGIKWAQEQKERACPSNKI